MTDVTDAILLIPPMMTSAAKNVTTTATAIVIAVMFFSSPIVKSVGAWKNVSAADAMPLICVIVPIPNAPAMQPNIANSLPSHFAFQPYLSLMPLSI